MLTTHFLLPPSFRISGIVPPYPLMPSCRSSGYLYFYVYEAIQVSSLGAVFLCLTDKRRPIAPPDALTAFRLTSRVGEVYQSMTGDGQTITVIITFIKSNKNSLE